MTFRIFLYISDMKPKVRHPRLYAFYDSKIINSLYIVTIISLLMCGCSASLTPPLACASLSFLFAVGYSVWFWTKKPQTVVTNKWLSSINGLFTLYFLIIVAMKTDNQWWYIFPLLCGVTVLFITMINPKDETVDLSHPSNT